MQIYLNIVLYCIWTYVFHILHVMYPPTVCTFDKIIKDSFIYLFIYSFIHSLIHCDKILP